MVVGPKSSKTTIGGSSLAQAAFHHFACLAVMGKPAFHPVNSLPLIASVTIVTALPFQI